jgi:type I restriction enzyme S subunit
MRTQSPSSEWKRTTLQHCCFRPEYGYTASASKKPIGPKFLRITDIQNGKVDWSKVPHVRRPEEGEGRYLLESGDIVIARIGATTGKAYLIQQCPEAMFASYLIRVKTKPGLLPKFLNYCLQTSEYWQHINSQKGGRLKGGVNIPILENLEIPFPSAIEQAAVVRVLDAVQEANEARQRELVLERERKATLIEHLFTHGTHGEPTTHSKIGEIPESWQVIPLGECAELITKGSSPNWQGFEYTADGVIFVRSQNVGWGRLELTDVAHLPPAFNAKEKKSILRKDDILVNIVGASIGRAALATTETAGGNVNQAVALVRLRSEEFEPAFFMNYIFTMTGQRQLHSQKKDIARANLSLQDLTEFLVPLAPKTEQSTIAVTMRAAEAKIQSLEREVALIEELFQTLLEELMTGQISALPLIEEHQAR